MEIIISYISKERGGGTVFCSFPDRAFLKDLTIRIFSYSTRLLFNLVGSPFVKILCRLISDQFCLLISQIAFEISDMPATFMSKIVLVCYNRWEAKTLYRASQIKSRNTNSNYIYVYIFIIFAKYGLQLLQNNKATVKLWEGGRGKTLSRDGKISQNCPY